MALLFLGTSTRIIR